MPMTTLRATSDETRAVTTANGKAATGFWRSLDELADTAEFRRWRPPRSCWRAQ
jgi:hypothetical protein